MRPPYQLPGELTIYSAMETRDSLLAWATEPSAQTQHLLDVSAASVREVDGSGLQLLAALSNMNLPWRLVDASPEFIDACHTLGLTEWLQALPTERSPSATRSAEVPA